MLSLVHLIYMAGDKCMRQNACFNSNTVVTNIELFQTTFVVIEYKYQFYRYVKSHLVSIVCMDLIHPNKTCCEFMSMAYRFICTFNFFCH